MMDNSSLSRDHHLARMRVYLLVSVVSIVCCYVFCLWRSLFSLVLLVGSCCAILGFVYHFCMANFGDICY